jgi:TRAP-type mannitol/chloroaromatic compound transport system permease small subunit
MPIGVGLLLLQGVAELLKNFTIVLDGGEQHES